VVSPAFEDKNKINQHRMIHSILSEELASSVHAVAIQTIPVSKWNEQNPPTPDKSPNCMGGMKHEQRKE
jgi:BolA family transcriptional regulator, general stress-responsive regulator